MPADLADMAHFYSYGFIMPVWQAVQVCPYLVPGWREAKTLMGLGTIAERQGRPLGYQRPLRTKLWRPDSLGRLWHDRSRLDGHVHAQTRRQEAGAGAPTEGKGAGARERSVDARAGGCPVSLYTFSAIGCSSDESPASAFQVEIGFLPLSRPVAEQGFMLFKIDSLPLIVIKRSAIVTLSNRQR